MNANPLNAYRETRVRTASQGKLIVMLYDEAIRQLDSAIKLVEGRSKKLDQVHNSIVKAQDIVTELMVSLDFEQGGEIARNLFNLYMFFTNQLMEANVAKQPEPLKMVRHHLAELRDAWTVVAKGRPDVKAGSAGVNLAG